MTAGGYLHSAISGTCLNVSCFVCILDVAGYLYRAILGVSMLCLESFPLTLTPRHTPHSCASVSQAAEILSVVWEFVIISTFVEASSWLMLTHVLLAFIAVRVYAIWNGNIKIFFVVFTVGLAMPIMSIVRLFSFQLFTAYVD